MASELKTEKEYFVKSIGYARTGSGAIRAKTFYLGAVADGERKALAKANEIRLAWDAIKAGGGDRWTPEAIEALNDVQRSSVATAAVAMPVRAGTKQTMREVIGDYLDGLDRRASAGQISTSHADGERYRLTSVGRIIGDTAAMNTFDESKLTAAVLAICGRPTTAHVNRETSTTMTTTTATAYLKCFRTFLTWAASTPIEGTTDRPLWIRPLRFDEIFRSNKPVMKADERQTALESIVSGTADVTTFNVAELPGLFKFCRNDAKLYFLLALNCGFANEEIADLKTYEIKLDDPAGPYIHRFRGKTERPGDTGVYAKWPLWKETADRLRIRFEYEAKQTTPNPEQLALRNENGRRLIVGRADTIAAAWRLASKHPEGSGLSFKYLRKTSATMIQNDLGFGQHVADAFLSHGGRGVLASYTPQDWTKVAEAVKALRGHLQVIFDVEKQASDRMKAIAEKAENELDAADAERNRRTAAKAVEAIRRHQRKMAAAV